MVAAREDLYIEQGATFDRTWIWRETLPDGALGDPIDLTGYSARMELRASIKADEVLLRASTVANTIILGGTAGTVQVLIPDEDTMLLTVATAVYDLELESAGGYVYRLLQGKVTVSPNVTRAEVD